MSTYNGEAFLADQLDSLLQQRFTDWRLVIRDDGSKDTTREIAARYAADDARITLLDDSPDPEKARNKGACQGFGTLLQAVSADRLMFCDQDDIWFPDKIGLCVEALERLERRRSPGVPLLVHTDLRLIDGAGKTVAESYLAVQGIRHIDHDPLARLLVQNFVTGCAMIFNRELREIALPIPEEAYMHDWWLALVAAATGELEFLRTATLGYRQHSANAIGVRSLFSVRNLRRVLRQPEQLDRLLAASGAQASVLQQRLAGVASPATLGLIEAFTQAMRRGGPTAIVTLLRRGVRRQGLARNIVLALLLLKNSYGQMWPDEPGDSNRIKA
jgi:hypothetical protein